MQKKNYKHTQIKPNVSEINFPKSNLVMGIVYKIKIQKGYKKKKQQSRIQKKKKESNGIQRKTDTQTWNS